MPGLQTSAGPLPNFSRKLLKKGDGSIFPNRRGGKGDGSIF